MRSGIQLPDSAELTWQWQRPIRPCPISAPSRSTRAPPAARRRSGTRPKQLLVCPFCGTASPFTVDAATGRDRGARSGQGAARAAGRGARLAGREAHGPVPELQGGLGVRSRARRPELRVLRLAGARRLHGDQGARSARRACCRSRSPRHRCASRSAAGTRASGWRPASLKSRALVDRVHGVYIPYWTFDAQVVCPWEAEAGHYYYTTETYRDAAAARRRARCGTCAGSRRPARSSTSSTTSRCRARRAYRTRCCKQVEPFPTQRAACRTTARSSRASSSSTTRSCCSTRRSDREDAMTDKLQRDVRGADSGRHLPQPADPSRVSRTRRSSTSSCRSGC